MFGEDTAGGKAPLASTNAYMLNYRQIDSRYHLPSIFSMFLVIVLHSKAPMQIAEILPAVKTEIEAENEQFLKEKAEYIKRRDNLTIKVSFLTHPYVVSIYLSILFSSTIQWRR